MKPYLVAGLALTASTMALAQQAPPPGVAVPDLNTVGYIFDTAEVHGIQVNVLAKDFARPFAMEFLPDGDLLVVERGQGLLLMRNAANASSLEPATVAGLPVLDDSFPQSGIYDIAVHPGFAENGLLYWTWNDPVPNAEDPSQPPEQAYLTVMRGHYAGGAIAEVQTIYRSATPGYPGGSRLALTESGMLWIATGSPFGPEGRDPASPHGKVLRLRDNGSIPADNPFVDVEGANPAVYSVGHRDQHGLVVHPQTGQVFTAEHGPNGGDEVNLITAGGDYGWPDYSFGRNYDGTSLGVPAQGPGISDPLLLWQPSIAPSGLLFYTGEAFPQWQGNLFIGSGRWGEINNTGSLQRVVFNQALGEVRREALLQPLHHRVRDVVQGPDGNIYVLTDGPSNAVLRISPSN